MECRNCGKIIEDKPKPVPNWLWNEWKEGNTIENGGPYCEKCIEENDLMTKCRVCKERTDRFIKDYRTTEYGQTDGYHTCPRCMHLNDRMWWALFRNEDLSLKELESGEAYLETVVRRD